MDPGGRDGGLRQRELLRRVTEINPAAPNADLIRKSTPAGRGRAETDLDPHNLPDEEILRVASSAIADCLLAKGLPPETEPLPRPRRNRRYVLAGDPWLARPLRADLIARGRPPGGRGARAWVLATHFDQMLVDAWSAACFDTGPTTWHQWLDTWAHRGQPPTRVDLVAIARRHAEDQRRPTIVTDLAALPSALGASPRRLPTAAASDLARRVAIVLGVLVTPDERRALLRTHLLPQVEELPGPALALPGDFAAYATEQAARMTQQLAAAGYPVLGSLDTLAPRLDAGHAPGTAASDLVTEPTASATLDLAVRLLARVDVTATPEHGPTA